MIKILKIVTNVLELAMKAEKNSCNRVHSRSELTEIKHMLFRDLAC